MALEARPSVLALCQLVSNDMELATTLDVPPFVVIKLNDELVPVFTKNDILLFHGNVSSFVNPPICIMLVVADIFTTWVYT